MAYEQRQTGTDYVAAVSGFLMVRLLADHQAPERRSVVATCKVNGEAVASGSAADNYEKDVISSATQTFTVPIHSDSKYRVDVDGGGVVQMRWTVL